MLCDMLRAFRAYCDLSQEQVADMINVDRLTYVAYEAGTSVPSNKNLELLAKIFNVPKDKLADAFSDEEKYVLKQAENAFIAILESGILTEEEVELLTMFRACENKAERLDAVREALS